MRFLLQIVVTLLLALLILGCVSEVGMDDNRDSRIVESQQTPSSEEGSQRGILTTLKDLVDPIIPRTSSEGVTSNWLAFVEGSDSQLMLIIIGVGIALAALCAVMVSAILV